METETLVTSNFTQWTREEWLETMHGGGQHHTSTQELQAFLSYFFVPK